MTRTKKRTVLVVDDEPHVRHYLGTVLQDAGFCVLTASDGQEGLELVRAHSPDFVSVDLAMPRKTGHHLLLEMKRDASLSQIPVVIVTAHARDALGARMLAELEDAGYLASPDGYLEKPVAASKYVAVVQQALGIDDSGGEPSLDELRAALTSKMADASPEALRKALEVLSREVQDDGT